MHEYIVTYRQYNGDHADTEVYAADNHAHLYALLLEQDGIERNDVIQIRDYYPGGSNV